MNGKVGTYLFLEKVTQASDEGDNGDEATFEYEKDVERNRQNVRVRRNVGQPQFRTGKLPLNVRMFLVQVMEAEEDW